MAEGGQPGCSLGDAGGWRKQGDAGAALTASTGTTCLAAAPKPGGRPLPPPEGPRTHLEERHGPKSKPGVGEPCKL